MRFETTMTLSGNNTGIEVPPEVIEALGAGRKPPVQVTVNGFPLYYWQNDEAAGDANGQGVNNIWWVVDADGETVGN